MEQTILEDLHVVGETTRTTREEDFFWCRIKAMEDESRQESLDILAISAEAVINLIPIPNDPV